MSAVALAEAARARIALCMIVRDEEEMLARCLASVRGIAGEIVVVDTGSTDRTIAIAEQHGARVLGFPWSNDFAEARNVALEAATRPWALVLDADEELVVGDAAPLERAVLDSDATGYLVALRNLLDGGHSSRAEVLRLLRRDLPGMRYRGALHEQIVAVAEGRATVARLAGVEILHHGYAASVVARKNKGARNRALAESLTAARPDDPFAWFCLGLELESPGERAATFGRALALLDGGEPIALGQTWVANLLLHLAKALEQANDASAAGRVVERALALFPGVPDLHVVRGGLRLAQGDAEGAAADFAASIPNGIPASIPDGKKPSPIVMTEAALAYEGRVMLAGALVRARRLDAAEAVLREAVTRAPESDVAAHRMLALVLAERGAAAESVPLFRLMIARDGEDEMMRRGLAEACYKLGFAALERGAVADAAALWREAIDARPGHKLATEGLRLLGITI